jgi:DNA-binding LacI/PurR family transcriptional regulator
MSRRQPEGGLNAEPGPERSRDAEWVRTDHAHGLDLAVAHLREQGHRRVGLVLDRDSPTSAHLLRAWRAARADPALAAVLAAQWWVTPGQGVTLLRDRRPAHRVLLAPDLVVRASSVTVRT